MVIGHVDDILLPGGRDPLPGGFLGVDVFFVLSGFLITRLLLDERQRTGSVALGRFYGRRAARLLPALALLLVAHALWVRVADVGVTASVELDSVLVIALYVSNWAQQLGREVAFGLGHLWSLAVEEQFYLVWPCLVWATRRRTSALWAASTAGIVVALAVRNHLWDAGEVWLRIYIRTDARMDALLIGCLLALAHHRGWLEHLPRRARPVLAGVGLVVVLGAAASLQPDRALLYRGGFTVVALGTALLIATLVGPDWWLSRWMGHALPRAVGRVSYGLYLWHPLVFDAVDHAWPSASRPVAVALGLTVTGAVVVASWWFVERPVLAWAHGRFARPGAPAPTALVPAPAI